MSAPRIELRLDQIEDNARHCRELLEPHGIGVVGVTKAVLGSPEVARALLAGGITGLADSRLQNVERLRAAGIDEPVTLLRPPMPSELDRVVRLCESSLATEPDVLVALSHAAVAAARPHGVVLAVELGDRREGIMPDDVVGVARLVEGLAGLTLEGIGANLACRHGVRPDEASSARLTQLALAVEAAVGHPLARVSGGSSSHLSWVLGGGAVGRLDELRLGEAILLGCDPLDRRPIPGLHTGACSLVAEVVESKWKPSAPEGERALNAFGERVEVADRGIVAQSILAIGRQDVDPDGLHPPSGATVAGSSSDHLIVEAAALLAPGHELRFGLSYGALLRAMTSPFVERCYLGARSTVSPPTSRRAP